MINEPTVAVFDFDGTMIHGDSFLPYLARVRGRRPVAVALGRRAPHLAAMIAGWRERDALKEEVLAELLAGVPLDHATAVAKAYVPRLEQRVRLNVLKRLRDHQTQGHQVVIVSASPLVYLKPFAERLNVDAVLATELEVSADGRFTGRFVGRNCRGSEKVARLRAWLDDRPVRLYAYGDSGGDRELLEFADAAWVRSRRPMPALE